MDLSTKLAGVELKNPFMNASGVLSATPGVLKGWEKSGAGAVVSKSLTKDERLGNNGPTVLQFSEDIWINRMGLPNPGIDYFIDSREYILDIPLIVSVAGSSEEEYIYNSRKASEIATILEINYSCPNIKGGMICFDLKQLYNINRKIVEEVDIPVFAKLSPYTDTDKLKKTIEVIAKTNSNGVVLTNTAPALNIITLDLPPQLTNIFMGGQSGFSIFPISLRNIYEANKYIEEKGLELELIGVGGIKTWEEAVKYILCGAKAVQLGSAAVSKYDDYRKIIKDMCKGLEKYMKENNYNSIEDFRGIAKSFDDLKKE